MRLLLALISALAPPAPTPHVLWVKVERPSFDLWGVIVTSFEFVLLSIALALVLGTVLGWLLIRRARPGPIPAGPALGLQSRPLPSVEDGLGSRPS